MSLVHDDECDGCCHPSEPECVDGSHDWTSEGTGGCSQNPGVWSLGGTTIRTAERCRRCGCIRTETRYGSQRNPYQCDEVSYSSGEPDEES